MLRGTAGLVNWRLWYLGVVWVRYPPPHPSASLITLCCLLLLCVYRMYACVWYVVQSACIPGMLFCSRYCRERMCKHLTNALTFRSTLPAGQHTAAEVIGRLWAQFLVETSIYGVLFWAPLLLDAMISGNFSGTNPKAANAAHQTNAELVRAERTTAC